MPTKNARKKSLYSVHPVVAYTQTMIDCMPARTGRSLVRWVAIVKKDGPQADKDRAAWLKAEFDLGRTTVSLIVERAAGRIREDSDPDAYLRAAVQYVEEMYSGGKAGLRSIHDALVKLGRSLGDDVRVCPCKTIVPLYRNHVFAEIKPSTRTRIDFGLALKRAKRKPPKRLIDTGGLAKKDRITHRIPIRSLDKIDAEVRDWLRIAYELDA